VARPQRAGRRALTKRAIASLLGGLLLALDLHAAELPPPLARVLRSHQLPDSAVSVLVQPVDARTPVLAHGIDTPRNPASTIKLVTSFVALDVLGPTHRWRTEAYTLGPIRDGVLEGDLLLKGYGDPWLIEEEWWKFAGQVRRQGLRHVRGRLLIDDSHWTAPARDAGSFDGQPFRLYNVQPNALMVNFKAFSFDFSPHGGAVRITSNPAMPNLEIVNELRLVQGRCPGVVAAVKMAQPDPGNADRIVFRGDYPAACGTQSLPRSAMEPASYAYGLFRQYWAQWGGSLDGGVARATRPAGAKPFATRWSPPLAEVIRPLNKWSNNVMADALLYALAAKAGPPPLTPAMGAGVVRDWFVRQGLPVEGFVMENGSGLSRQSRISARQLSGLLLRAAQGPTMPEFMASLSLSGLDGTMHRRFRNGPERGRMHLKTGHLNEVAAVAGYVLAANGRRYVVTLFVNHPAANRGGGSALIDALLAWTYRLP
jgi:D-alanyl-D-alanine carboxypeptidase/D-alanyl-D-alanine-endopeptidase (penicillin-binding protein 4)